MSVIHYSDEELAGLWHRLGKTDEVGLALHILGIANRAAYMLTYAPRHADACTIDVPRLDEATPSQPPRWSATDWVRNLLYNCLSNGGTDFADRRARETALAAAAKADAAALLADVTNGAPEPAFSLAFQRLTLRVQALRRSVSARDGDPAHWEEELEHFERLRNGLTELADEAMPGFNQFGDVGR
jgi:hypothetical protein